MGVLKDRVAQLLEHSKKLESKLVEIADLMGEIRAYSKMMEVLPDVCVLETVQVYLNTISTKGVGRATEVKEGGASEGGATGVGGAKLTLYCCGLCDSYLPSSQGQMLEWARKRYILIPRVRAETLFRAVVQLVRPQPRLSEPLYARAASWIYFPFP